MTKQKNISLILIYVSIVISIFLFGIFYAVKKPVQAVESNNSQDLSQRVKEYLKNDDLYYAYVKGDVQETQLIAFHEVGFNKTDHKILKYHFYLYVPKKHKLQDVQKDLEMRYFNNRIITLSGHIVEKNDSDRFYLIEMTCRHDFDGQHIIEKGVEKGYREYVLGYIPWRYEGVDYQPEHVDRIYTFKGYQKGLDESSKEGSTLKGSYKETKYLDLDVKSVCYSGGLVDYNSRFQIFSVYFGIPKHITDKYGYLAKIKASYYETKTAPVLISDNDKIVNEFQSSAKNKYKPRVSDVEGSRYLGRINYVSNMHPGGIFGEIERDFYTDIYDLDGNFKKYNANRAMGGEDWIVNYREESFKKFSYAIKRSSLKEYKISSEELKKMLPMNPKELAQSGQTAEDEKGKTRASGNYQEVFENGEPIKTTSLKEKTTAFQRFWHFGFNKPDVSTKVDFEIRIVKIEDDIFSSDAQEKYKIDEIYLSQVRADYIKNKAKLQDTYLLRYAVRKVTFDSIDNLELFKINKSPKQKGKYYKSREAKGNVDKVNVPMFLDFNIISLTFKNQTEETEILTKSSPINHIPDLIVPEDRSLKGRLGSFSGNITKILKILGMVLGLLMAVTVVGLVTKLVPKGNTKIKIDPGMDLSKNRNKIKERRKRK